MILNLGSLMFNAYIDGGGGTPAWGTEMGQGDGYRFNFEDMSDFFTGMVYNSISDIDKVYCPLGKGGNQIQDYDFVIASVFKKIFVNNKLICGAEFLLLVVKKLVGEYHIGRRTLKYNPRMTYRGLEINDKCYKAVAATLGISQNAAWFINEINIKNQDELHFTAYVLDESGSIVYPTSEARKNAMTALIGTRLKNKDGNEDSFDPNDESPRQMIWYGAPGTGKSFTVNKKINKYNSVRTTFHPDSDYASFVGAYKPTMIEISSRDMAGHIIVDKGREVKEKKIVYEFVAQAFLKAYTEAWKRSVGMMTDQQRINAPLSVDWDNKYYLVIEEINRGNCAQIFGDLFQLLDRDDNGESSYAIHPDKDIQRYLAEQFEDCKALPEAIRKGEEMKLPRNLYIFATMNTSDQSLFPIDSAFKRRWDWEYVPIKDEKKGYYIKVGDSAYSWSDFLANINEKILKATNSDDKQMGYWFVHLPEGQKEISTDKFVGKVLFYLWNDVFKDFGDGEDSIFIGEKEDGAKYDLRFKSFFGDERDERISDLMRYNKVEPIELADDADEKIAEKLEDSDDSISIDKTSTAYTKWKKKHDTYWAACQEAYASDQILKLGHRNDYPNAYDVPLTDGNGVIMRIWHLTHKGEKCMALGVRISETASLEIVDALVEAIPEWNEKFNLKFAHLSLNTGSQIRACSPQYDFNNPKDVEASIEWVKNLANNFYNTVEDILKGKE